MYKGDVPDDDVRSTDADKAARDLRAAEAEQALDALTTDPDKKFADTTEAVAAVATWFDEWKALAGTRRIARVLLKYSSLRDGKSSRASK